MYMINTLLDDYQKNHLRKYKKRNNTIGCLKELKDNKDNFNLLIEDYIENLKHYNRKFSVILNLKFGEKIGKDDSLYYIFPNGYFQQMSRWWYNENRFKTYEYIEKDLDDFTKFLDKFYNDILLSNDFKAICLNKDKKGLYNKTTNFNHDLCEFIKLMVVGIYTLKKTYADIVENNYIIFGNQEGEKKAKEIVDLIDLKITKMLYFKNQFLQTFQ